MATLKLLDCECDFKLIGIHTLLPDYRLAYFLNRELNLQLRKEDQKEILWCPIALQYYSYYIWYNSDTETQWHCIGNKLWGQRAMLAHQLFDTTHTVQYLIAPLKKIDYFLKIDTEGRLDTAKILKQLNLIPSTTAYSIEPNSLNLKYKLLFQEC